MSEDQDTSKDGFIVPAPFDSLSPGDCILQSIEGVQFKAVRQILALASPMMADMFALPQAESQKVPREETSDHLPIIPMQEDAETIHNLLVLLYPTSLLGTLGVQATIKLVKAYDKYLIPKDRLLLSVVALYNTKSALEASPIELYRMAWELEMMEEAKIASRYMHGIPFKDLHAALPLEPLEKLLDLRRRREEELDSLIAVAGLRSRMCSSHGGGDYPLFNEIVALKAKVRQSIQVPYPEEGASASLFFGLTQGYPPTHPQSGDSSYNYSRRCSCFNDGNLDYMSPNLVSALQKFPQCI
ncbi:hypothetical protein M407DRAFT_25787 [Tulasnella calospora MUT 4182]|uniref:BTB domain-containing protein n=2 Tax=Tulasnella calospora MUT 4182 TaxID=1051891 RepID=A0A0C3QFG7_9AGAM|nr:hypothetical protein M407DRAFT_25787 [Tulasnella calospora MUT 4182]